MPTGNNPFRRPDPADDYYFDPTVSSTTEGGSPTRVSAVSHPSHEQLPDADLRDPAPPPPGEANANIDNYLNLANPAQQRDQSPAPSPRAQPPPPPPPHAAPSETPVPRTPPEAAGSNSVLTVGTLIVMGAMAANVFGFRYSKWAVGKDIHRAWERQQRNAASSSSWGGASSSQRARSRARAEEARRRAEAERRAEEARRRAEAERRAEEARRSAQEAERRTRESAREAYQAWERTFRRGDGFWQESFRVDFDTRNMEDFMRGRRRGRSPFGMPEELLQELLRAAQAAQQAQGRGRQAEDFDAFRFWEQVHGAEWRSAQGGRQGREGVFRGPGLARHYAALGLQQGASDEEVKKAYRREVMKWHPDRYRGSDKEMAARRFREVTAAYDALKK